MAPILLSKSQSQELVKKLEVHGYQSLQVRSAIVVEHSFKPHDLQVWVDSWPQFTTVLLVNNLQVGSDTWQICNVFSLDEEKLKEMLDTPELINWKTAKFPAYPLKYKHILEIYAERFGCSLSGPPCEFELMALNREKSKPREIPEEISASSLTPDQAAYVYDNWEYKGRHSQVNEELFKILIESYPTVCLFNSEGKPIASALGQIYGGIGTLFVEPEYRRRGLGKLVMYLLAEKYSDIGFPPYVLVASRNTVSIKMHSDLGYESTDYFINWYSLRSKSSSD